MFEIIVENYEVIKIVFYIVAVIVMYNLSKEMHKDIFKHFEERIS